MQVNRKYKTARGIMFYNSYIVDFNPYEPKKELIELLENTVTPSSGGVTSSKRGLKISEIDIELAEYMFYELKMKSEKLKTIAGLRYFILMALDTPIKEDLYFLMEDEEAGIAGFKDRNKETTEKDKDEEIDF